MTLLLGSLQLGLMYGLLAMGVYISFRILNTPDLTAEGSFTLGVAVSAMVTVAGAPYLGLLAAFLCGMAAGAVTGLLQTKVGVHPILAGILTMSGLYTVNLAVMGASSNVSLIGKDTLFQRLFTQLAPMPKDTVKLLVGLALAVLTLMALIWFFKTHVGLCIRATGNNEAMVRSSSINASAMKVIGLAVSNGCIALSGAIVAQYQGYADISSGIGILVVGLASVIIGEALFGRRGVTFGLISAIAGSVAYRIIISLALSTNIFPTYFLKLISAVIVAIALSLPTVKEQMVKRRIRREGKSRA
ncbi:MAG TPA: ABC transporter permease [Candidatus Limiplasma sp.]|nr:ABC transporter permease [Candidatus Limiplasma sp.]HPS80409.1 ABC transporter permease [Candidatus Limiplasma sp.]